MAGWGLGAWGLAPWGLGGAVIAVDQAVIPDEGGIILTISGTFLPSVRANVTLGGAPCPLPSALGGVDAVGGSPGTGPHPVASTNGFQIRCVAPQLPVGFHNLVVQQVAAPAITLVNAVEVVRRDWWTRLHGVRQKFPTPPYPPAAVGSKQLRTEGTRAVTAGERTPALEGQLFAMAAGLLEAHGVAYSRLTGAPFLSGSNPAVVSSAAGDVTQNVTVSGLDMAGNAQSTTLALNGVVPVVSGLLFSQVGSATLDFVCAGAVTISDGAGTPPERIVINAGYTSKSAGMLLPGDTTVVVEGNWRFPATGRLALKGERIAYSAKSTDSVCNYFTLATGVGERHIPSEAVADASGTATSLDLVRQALTIDGAEGPDIAVVSRRWGGLERPSELGDTLYRSLVKGSACSARGTIRGLVRLLTELYGAGSVPEIIEDLVSFVETVTPSGEVIRTAVAARGYPCTVWIDAGPLLSAIGAPFGRWYLTGGEPATSTDATHVTCGYTPTLVYGVYLDTDTLRTDNYCNLISIGDATLGLGAVSNAVGSAGGLFVAGDLGKPIVISTSTRPASNGSWLVSQVVGPGEVRIQGAQQLNGRVDGATLDVFEIDTGVPFDACPFGPDFVGREIVGFDPLGVFWGGAVVTRTISRFLDARHVQVSVPWPAAADEVTWRFMPGFPGVEAGRTWEMPRHVVAGAIVTLPRPLPGALTDVTIDYSAVPSGIIMSDTTERNNPAGTVFPAYIYGGDAWLDAVLEEFVPSGVRTRIGDPHA